MRSPSPPVSRGEGPGSAQCRLYLVAPETPDPALVERALDAAEVACFLFDAATVEHDEARRLVRLVQSRGVACLVADDAALAAALGADGVHLEDAADYRAARGTLGANGIVGVACGRSRHEAMEAAEQGADYVAFAAETADDLERLRDWSEAIVVPSVAWGARQPAAADIVATGTDFLAVDDIWSAPAGPATALRAYALALGADRRQP